MKIKSILATAAIATVLFAGVSSAHADAWSFGVISDTQWTGVADDGNNPNTVAAAEIRQIDQQFISSKVNLVVSIGDTVDVGTNTNIDTRALYSQDLYNAGIGFYPLRGNHEAGTNNSGTEWVNAFPQMTNGGINNTTPTSITSNASTIIGADYNGSNAPVAVSGSTFQVGTNFTYPTAVNTANNAMSYSFNYNNATFVMIDQFKNGGDENSTTIADQQSWITTTASNSNVAGNNTFVFSHKNILGGNHKDNLFGININNGSQKDPGDGSGVTISQLSAANQTAMNNKISAENNFIDSLAANGVHTVISGHDHHQDDSIVTSQDGTAKIHENILASDTSKFYTPASPYSPNEQVVSQQLNTVGYYIYTVDGPRVTQTYYSTNAVTTGTNITSANNLTFHKALVSGWSMNGTEFVINNSASYTVISDSTANAIANAALYGETGYIGTKMSILSGSNIAVLSSTAPDGRTMVKAVDTGWAPDKNGFASDKLTLWGMTEINSGNKTAQVALSLSYDPSRLDITGYANLDAMLASGNVFIGSTDASGNWVNAATLNDSGTPTFVGERAYDPSTDVLGDYGINPANNTAWVVTDAATGDFAVVPEPSTYILLGSGLAALFGFRRRFRK